MSETLRESVNKVAVALAAMAAMREYRKGKPVAFQWPTRPANERTSGV